MSRPCVRQFLHFSLQFNRQFPRNTNKIRVSCLGCGDHLSKVWSHSVLRGIHSSRGDAPSTFFNSTTLHRIGVRQLFSGSSLAKRSLAVPDAVCRFSSSSTVANSTVSSVSETPYIPEPPAPIDITADIIETVGEPSFVSLGLGGWTPVGLIESCLEYLHIGLDLPWWLAIGIGTVVVKFLMFPLVVFAQRNAAKMNNNLPQMQVLQMKLSEARRSGDHLLASKYTYELMMFMKEKEINPIKSAFVPLLQAPVFVSFFISLRTMANLPIESMTVGGLYWFTNLTVPDPFYLLPLITSATLFITIELGAEGGIRAGNMRMMKYVLRCIPLVILPFTVNFPAVRFQAILCYWTVSNFVSLGQVSLLRQPKIRKYFNIEQLVRHSQEATPLSNQKFIDSVKETWTNVKITQEMADRQRVDEMRFRKAGQGPIEKTYPYDPTKQKVSAVKNASTIDGLKAKNK